MSDSEDDFSESSGSEYESPVKKGRSAPKKPTSAGSKKKASATKKSTTTTTTTKKASTTRKPSSKKAKSDSESDDFSGNDDKSSSSDSENVFKSIASSSKKGKSIEEIYQKKELLDQILLRPDTYIGSTERQEEELWVWEDKRMVHRKVSFVPGIYKIFDEILVNAADNKQREGSMKFIKVVINREDGYISVTNDGAGIPIQIHSEHKIYIPELIFGNLLTSSHYDDSEKRLTGGRNGFGAKLANIFSTKFMVECADSKTKKLYKQTFTNNMRSKEDPKITSYQNKTDYTKITFYPELDRFGMVNFDDDLVALLSKRVYDIAGCNPTLKVSLNGEELGIRSFEKYINLYFPDEENAPKVYYEKVSDRWELAVTLSKESQFNQVSFVNSICTVKGGTHVTHGLSNLVTAIQEQVNKKNKGSTEIKPAFIKNHLSVFVNCLIENPHFDSQTKETLTSKISSFGSRCEPSDTFIKRVLDSKSGIVASILEFAQFKDQSALKRSTSGGGKKGKVSIPKLDDANLAGSAKSEDCTLILTEGDSAKSLATAGISVVGKDHYGAFPLKGKLLNVRDQSTKVINNDEINNIVTILGLKYGRVYESLSDLRYGHLMIMADQDHDGSHIKGLIINMVHHFWPTLLRMPGFLVEFITPIVKVFKSKQKPISFYTMPEFLKWRETNDKGWDIKYYKGLGTSTPGEGKEYFSDLERHKIDFEWDNEANDSIELAFSKSRADDRKKWMAEHIEGTFLEQFGVKKLSYSDFINKELVLFSIADCERSIPNIVDGLKTSHRKTLFSCFKRNLKKEIKVAQLIGYVSEHSAYHHGEASLYSTIVGMAQEFVGSNNINLLNPAGSYGTRIAGGKDCSSARYIHTRLNDITRAVYHPDDDPILSCVVDDGKKVQPKFYVPIIPMILVNGCIGIGTGWSSTIPNYNPRDLIKNMRLAIDGKPLEPIKPWYRGFLGSVEANQGSKVQGGQFFSKGVWNKLSDNRFEITELPVGFWTQDYREFLDELETPGTKKKKKEEKEKKAAGRKGTKVKPATTKRSKRVDDDDNEKVADAIIKSYTNYSSESTIHFIIDTIKPVDDINIEKVFKLISNINETNMVVFDEEGRIQRFATTAAIQEHFFPLRMKYYQMRKDFLSERLAEEFSRLSNKARFILAVVNKELVISNVKKVDIIKKLKEMKFDKIINKNSNKLAKEKLKKKKNGYDEEDAAFSSDEEGGEGDGEEEQDDDTKGYDYLLSLPLWSLTLERVKKLLEERDAKKKEWDILLGTPIQKIYKRDLDALEKALDEQDAYDQSLKNQTESLKKKTKTKALPRAKKISAKTVKDTKEAPLTKLVKPTVKVPTADSNASVAKRKKSEDLTTTTSNTKPIESFFTKEDKKPSEKKSTLVSLDSDDDDQEEVVSKPKAPSKKPSKVIELSDEEESNYSEPETPPPKKSKALPKKTITQIAAKSKANGDDSFINNDASSDDDVVMTNRPTRSTRAPPPKTLSFLDSESDDNLYDDEKSDSDSD
ncbi:hypothetical protein RB653_006557 [Dictyostelium firmibasis]|uniref:DNA topoisomerase 2 n=1 Tax=Dictyostelium firmibasis TaxID=79012 RepID=A0AAN7TMB6_9MYCE